MPRLSSPRVAVAGVASNGAGQLAGIDLDDAEWQAFGAGIARLARERERRPNDFDHFLQVRPRGPSLLHYASRAQRHVGLQQASKADIITRHH